jgi:hypothetical protein
MGIPGIITIIILLHTVGSYKKFNLSSALDWKKRAGLTQKQLNIVSRPQNVDF